MIFSGHVECCLWLRSSCIVYTGGFKILCLSKPPDALLSTFSCLNDFHLLSELFRLLLFDSKERQYAVPGSRDSFSIDTDCKMLGMQKFRQ